MSPLVDARRAWALASKFDNIKSASLSIGPIDGKGAIVLLGDVLNADSRSCGFCDCLRMAHAEGPPEFDSGDFFHSKEKNPSASL